MTLYEKELQEIYRISSKSHRGEILFQGSVWCGDNSRAASTEIDMHARTQLQLELCRAHTPRAHIVQSIDLLSLHCCAIICELQRNDGIAA